MQRTTSREAAALMAKSSTEEVHGGVRRGEAQKGEVSHVEDHPYAFHVSGPRTLPSPNWRDLIHSSWRDPNYKRMAIACFIQAAYLLELDRQNKRTESNALAPNWWKPFKYKVIQTLIDERDGSIYGAVLEWDRSVALCDLVVVRPSGAPRAVLALRGTLLVSPTARRDLEDDLRFLAWESLKGSVRFVGILAALRSLIQRFGSSRVYVGGHSLGAGFALQVGRALAKEGVFFECHLFNPPSVSLAMCLKCIGEKAGTVWKRAREMMPPKGKVLVEESMTIAAVRNQSVDSSKLVHLYVNNCDYICCYYTDRSGAEVTGIVSETDKGKVNGTYGELASKLFVMSNGPKKFLEAHGLQQWWSSDIELQLAVNHSKLLDRQLRSFYASQLPS